MAKPVVTSRCQEAMDRMAKRSAQKFVTRQAKQRAEIADRADQSIIYIEQFKTVDALITLAALAQRLDEQNASSDT